MSIANIYAALEEFTEEVTSEIAVAPPTDGDFGQTTANVDFETESGDIDSDVLQITQAAQGLEDIISLIEEAPGASTEPLQPYVEKAANVALESNDLVASAGNPLVGSGATKQSAIDKVKAFAQKVWDMLRNFGKRIAAWVREIFAKYTDRIVKNSNMAAKLLEQINSLEVKQGATVTDKAILAKVATFNGKSITDTLQAVSEHTRDQGGKASEELTKEARSRIQSLAMGTPFPDGAMDAFLEALGKAAGSYKEEAKPEQAQAVKAAASTTTYLSDPFFAGYRAWTTIPENVEAFQYWNHGISKVDEVSAKESLPAADKDEIKTVAETVVGMGALVAVYKNNLKNLDALNKELDAAASKAKSAESQSEALKKMQAVLPRIIKGPQVAAYGYAANASTAALQFCQASLAAHNAKPQEAEKEAEKKQLN